MPAWPGLTSEHHYVITAETHNSPSNMEPYGGALTGIVGVYRDPMGTGKGPETHRGQLRLLRRPAGLRRAAFAPPASPAAFGRDHRRGQGRGQQERHPHPRQVFFHPGYLGKCLVFVAALGFMPAQINGEPAAEKTHRTRRPDRHVRRPGGQRRDPRRHRLLGGLQRRAPRPVTSRSATPTPRKKCTISCWRPGTRG